jgi:DNA polymerase elongation subunit (family B)
VPNRFYAVAENGSLKVRGLALRRHDTPPLVTRMQNEVLAILSEADDFESYMKKLGVARLVFNKFLESIEEGSVPIEELVISKRISRSPKDYQKADMTAIAAQQIYGRGVRLRPGQTVEYVVTDARAKIPNDRVRSYAVWEGWHGYDRNWYRNALTEAFELFDPRENGQARLQLFR